MEATGPIIVVDYVDAPFDEVCELLRESSGHWVVTSHGRRSVARIGPIDRIADHVARLAVFGEDEVPVAELRVLAVSTGHESRTEVLVFAHSIGHNPTARVMALERARSILEGAMRCVHATARDCLPSRAS